jgi:centromeric protein E
MCWFYLFGFQRGVFVAGLREEVVNNAEQVLDLIKAGEGL